MDSFLVLSYIYLAISATTGGVFLGMFIEAAAYEEFHVLSWLGCAVMFMLGKDSVETIFNYKNNVRRRESWERQRIREEVFRIEAEKRWEQSRS